MKSPGMGEKPWLFQPAQASSKAKEVRDISQLQELRPYSYDSKSAIPASAQLFELSQVNPFNSEAEVNYSHVYDTQT